MRLESVSTVLKTAQISNIMKPFQWGGGQSSCMWSDRRTDITKLIVAFHNFEKASKSDSTGSGKWQPTVVT